MNKNFFRWPSVFAVSAAFTLQIFVRATVSLAADAPGDLAPLPLELPPAGYLGTPKNMPPDTTAEKPTGKPRPPFLAPKGVKNVALGKPVTSSDPNPITGELKQITDGKKDAFDENVVLLRKRTQWVQVDLQEEYNLFAILIWHEHKSPVVYRDVIVQVSDDPEFKTGVQTIFNNDQDNSSERGVGTDREYFEGYEGKLIDAKGVKARYVRTYSKGSTDNALNAYTEIEVYALPAK
ncbi:MAG: hypothetical protein HY298_24670 [Verrucomicrobia bacterium]|nr:hypothetical protein [Verrucomicrobiota bacterium]